MLNAALNCLIYGLISTLLYIGANSDRLPQACLLFAGIAAVGGYTYAINSYMEYNKIIICTILMMMVFACGAVNLFSYNILMGAFCITSFVCIINFIIMIVEKSESIFT